MKKILLLATITTLALVSRTQVLFNEVYTDPAAGHNEFFELYNTSTSSTPLSMDDYTIVTYFETPKEKGFLVMDLPNLTIAPKGYFVGASALPFSYQGVNNSTAADFSWNSAAFTSNHGYVKKWVFKSGDATDGNLFYDEAPLPSNFNDFFFRRTGVGATYSIFLYKNGTLINALIFGSGGVASVLPVIISMPPLFVDMTAASTDFTINFSTYGSIGVETVNQDAGNDNGYFRAADGLCGGWLKSDAQAQHTPKVTNGYVDGYSGTISVTALIQKGTVATGSTITYDVISAPSTSFPVTMDVYKDDGSTITRLDAGDNYIESNTENVVTDGAFTTWFSPYDANMLVVVKSSLGCIDKIMFVPNASTLPVTLIYFQGNMENYKVNLNWSVAQNELSSGFEIERSTDGKNFTSAGYVTATDKAGSENYTFSESANSNKIFYRLKMYDRKGAAELSKTLIFQSGTGNNSVKVINNPASDKLTMSFASASNQSVDIKLYDMAGRMQMTQKMSVNAGNNVVSMPLSPTMSKGSYIVEVINGSERQTARFIKQ